jgi:hypothetical protein
VREENELDEESHTNSSSTDESYFFDSDFNAESGDDDLFAGNIDKYVHDNNERECGDELEDDDALEDDDLVVREDGMQHLQNVIKLFNVEVDMDNPCFIIGMKFSGVEELRNALTTYSIRNRKKIRKPRMTRGGWRLIVHQNALGF